MCPSPSGLHFADISRLARMAEADRHDSWPRESSNLSREPYMTVEYCILSYDLTGWGHTVLGTK